MSISDFIKISFSICCFAFSLGCSDNDSVETVKAPATYNSNIGEVAGTVFSGALRDATAKKGAGFLKLYEISKNPDTYTVEYQEAANDALTELLYTDTELWINTFSDIDNFSFSFGVLPENVTEKQYDDAIRSKLARIKPNAKEKIVIRYVLDRI
ncbi:MAG: hypothetical protein NDI60_10565 [Elusimicrobiales bacterium]|nr:hypothetical protein [Elusimicrobiales bacterium]